MRVTFFRRYLLASVADICPRSDRARRHEAAVIRWEAHRLCNTKPRGFGAPKPRRVGKGREAQS